MKPITLYTSVCRENQFNAYYPHEQVVRSLEDLRQAVCYDHVFAKYKEDHRSIADFILSDCLPFDCDNDHSDIPAEWKTPADVAAAFPGVPFYVVYSRHHMKEKGSRSLRPRFHVIFPIDIIRDSREYSALKASVLSLFPFFDTGAKDAARFFYGVKDPVVEEYGGDADGTE